MINHHNDYPTMPPLERAELRQRAVWWPRAGTTNEGEPTFANPQELKVRWEEMRDQGIDNRGDTVGLDARVVLDRQISDGDVLWLGRLADWAGTGRLMEVIKFNQIPDVRGRIMRRTADLKRFRDSFPIPSEF